MSTPDVGFVSAALTLRPPRVAIVVPNDEHWRDWAMTALATASDYWGGVGFILVPYDLATGQPSTDFAAVVRAYDPDHVVALEVPWNLIEELYPGYINIEGVANDEERRQLIANARQDLAPHGAFYAREIVASWCSPMRQDWLSDEDENEKRAPEVQMTLTRRDPDDRFRFQTGFAPAPPSDTPSRLAATSSWRSDIGLLAAMRLGVAAEDIHDRPEPTLESLAWLVRPRGDAPSTLIWTSGVLPIASSVGLVSWFLQDQRLMQVSRAHLRDRAAIVVGDKAEDFALALAYDRVFGNGIWLTRALIEDDDILRNQVHREVGSLITELQRNASSLVVTSTSVPQKELSALAERVQRREFVFSVNGRRQPHQVDRETVQVRRADVGSGLLGWVLDEHMGASVAIPVSKHLDGSMEALMGLETPVPTKSLYPEGSWWMPYWYVDATLTRGSPSEHHVMAHRRTAATIGATVRSIAPSLHNPQDMSL